MAVGSDTYRASSSSSRFVSSRSLSSRRASALVRVPKISAVILLLGSRSIASSSSPAVALAVAAGEGDGEGDGIDEGEATILLGRHGNILCEPGIAYGSVKTRDDGCSSW